MDSVINHIKVDFCELIWNWLYLIGWGGCIISIAHLWIKCFCWAVFISLNYQLFFPVLISHVSHSTNLHVLWLTLHVSFSSYYHDLNFCPCFLPTNNFALTFLVIKFQSIFCLNFYVQLKEKNDLPLLITWQLSFTCIHAIWSSWTLMAYFFFF